MDEQARVLINPEHDQLLRRHGFVTFPLIGPEEIAMLREAYGSLRGWEGQGFQSDLTVDDPDYRRSTSKAISSVLDQVVTSQFAEFSPFLRNFLCKAPGDGSGLYLHQDWMYVDERSGARTYVAWIALEDIDGHNGQLRVLRGSHLLDSGVRGTALTAPWLEHGDVIEERLQSIPVKAGDVIVFDNSLVHSSFPNHTEIPRLAAAVGMRPSHEPLVHFRRIDEDRAARFEVTEDFFCTATPQALLKQEPELPVAEIVVVDRSCISREALQTQLDAGTAAKIAQVRRSARRLGEQATQATTNAWCVTSKRVMSMRREPRAKTKSDQPWSSRIALRILAANEAMINRFGPEMPAVWRADQFAWSRMVEQAWPEIRAEAEALLVGRSEIPHIEDVTGGIPQGNVGPWRSFVMMHQGSWIPWNCERCPRTTQVVRAIPGLTVAGFSVLEAGTHITTHRGPNKGALRYQLGVIVPGEDGDCRIRVGDEMIVWREGEGVVFDFTVEHEAWNDTEETRVLLMLEFLTPLPWYLDRPNRLAQRAMGWFPTTKNLPARLKSLEPSLVRVPDPTV